VLVFWQFHGTCNAAMQQEQFSMCPLAHHKLLRLWKIWRLVDIRTCGIVPSHITSYID
jgi:hypothetical protein